MNISTPNNSANPRITHIQCQGIMRGRRFTGRQYLLRIFSTEFVSCCWNISSDLFYLFGTFALWRWFGVEFGLGGLHCRPEEEHGNSISEIF